MSKYNYDTVSNIYMSRRKFDKSHCVKTSMKVGKLTPIDIQEVLPGDGWYTKMRAIMRLSTAFLRPVMDNFFVDTYHFFVPSRLLYNNYDKVFGNPSPNAYVETELDNFPVFRTKITVYEKTVGDYLGLPVGGADKPLPKGISVMPFRAFAKIYEDWFRNQNTVQPILISDGDVLGTEYPNNNPWEPTNYSGQLPNIGKLNDYFTSCLPAPQKGEPVTLPLAGNAPVTGGVYLTSPETVHDVIPLRLWAPGMMTTSMYPVLVGGDVQNPSRAFMGGSATAAAQNGELNISLEGHISSNAVADLSKVSAVNINDLRFAFQMQKMLEKDARGGTRYREYIRSHFGVAAADVRMEIPEYLGGMRTPLNLQQVAQTSEATAASPLGSLGAYSQSYVRTRYSKSFDEHGFILTLAAVRYKHSYQQGINKLWFRSAREDFYDPLFANLGEQPVYKSQLYGFGDEELKDSPFAYQEAWADYRYAPDNITGEMRSSAQNTFDIWHFADYYDNAPSLTQDFTDENAEFFRRTTAISGNADVDDFICQFYFDSYVLRSMPIRSIPGLIDHH